MPPTKHAEDPGTALICAESSPPLQDSATATLRWAARRRSTAVSARAAAAQPARASAAAGIDCTGCGSVADVAVRLGG